MDSFWTSLIAGTTSGTVLAAILGFLLARRTETIKKEVEAQFLRLLDRERFQRGWKERAVSELLVPVCIQLDRTKRAFARWETKNIFLEAKVIRDGNLVIRDLLLKNPHLIPPELLQDAGRFVEHYDRWIEEFEKIRGERTPELDAPFVFVGPKGFPFPSDAEKRFHDTFAEYWQQLYGERKDVQKSLTVQK